VTEKAFEVTVMGYAYPHDREWPAEAIYYIVAIPRLITAG
jgi:hypothetical protein